MRNSPERENGIRDRSLSQQLRSKTGIKDPGTRWQWHPKNERTTSEFNRKALGLEFIQRANKMSSGFW
jgi:hypothetical protein